MRRGAGSGTRLPGGKYKRLSGCSCEMAWIRLIFRRRDEGMSNRRESCAGTEELRRRRVSLPMKLHRRRLCCCCKSVAVDGYLWKNARSCCRVSQRLQVCCSMSNQNTTTLPAPSHVEIVHLRRVLAAARKCTARAAAHVRRRVDSSASVHDDFRFAATPHAVRGGAATATCQEQRRKIESALVHSQIDHGLREEHGGRFIA